MSQQPVDAAPGYGAVVIESVTKCFGNCDGCVLTEQQRRDDETNKGGPMAWAVRYSRDALAPVVRSRPGAGAFVVLAQGEHLEVEPVETVVDWAEASMPHKDGLTEFTTALLMPNARAKHLLQRVFDRSIELRQPLLPNIVFSPKKVMVDGFRAKYLENIATTIEIFGTTDFTLNIGADVLDMLPARAFHEMVVAAGIKQVEVNLIPTIDSAPKFVGRYREMIGWLRELGRHWLDGNERYWVPYMANLADMSRRHYGLSLEQAKDFLVEHFTSELYLTLDGKVYLAASGGAAVTMPFSGAVGFSPVQSGFPEHDAQAIQRYGERLAMRLWTQHLRYEACRSCPHTTTCIASGFTPALGLVAPSATRDKKCPIGVADLIDDAHRAIVGGNPCMMDSYDMRVVQRNVVSEEERATGTVDCSVHEDARRFPDAVSVDRKRRLIDIPVVVQRD